MTTMSWTWTDVAQIVFTARWARIELHSLANYNAPVLANVCAITLKTPKLFSTRGVLVSHRVTKSLHNAVVLVRIAFLSQVQLPGSVDVDTVLKIAHHVTRETVKLGFGLLSFLRLVHTCRSEFVGRSLKFAKEKKSEIFLAVSKISHQSGWKEGEKRLQRILWQRTSLSPLESSEISSFLDDFGTLMN